MYVRYTKILTIYLSSYIYKWPLFPFKTSLAFAKNT